MWVRKGEWVWEELFGAGEQMWPKYIIQNSQGAIKHCKNKTNQKKKPQILWPPCILYFYVLSFPHLYISYLIFLKLLSLWIILTGFSAAAVFTPFSCKNGDSVCNPSSVSVATVGSLALTEKTVLSMSGVLDQWVTGSQKLKGGSDWAHFGWALC